MSDKVTRYLRGSLGCAGSQIMSGWSGPNISQPVETPPRTFQEVMGGAGEELVDVGRRPPCLRRKVGCGRRPAALEQLFKSLRPDPSLCVFREVRRQEAERNGLKPRVLARQEVERRNGVSAEVVQFAGMPDTTPF